MLYLVFNEGYTASSGERAQRADLTAEAIRLVRLVHAQVPADGEVAGLLALMLLTEARRAARTDADGLLVPLAEQDRSRWDPRLIEEGVGLISRTLGRGPVGPYQLQAAIAAVHDEAATADDTDWPQILALYDVLRAGLARAGGHAQPGRRGGDGARAAGRAGRARHAGRRRADRPRRTASTRSGRTCWRCPATGPAPSPPTAAPPSAPPASPNSTTWPCEPPA